MELANGRLRLKWLGIDTYKEAVIYIREDSPVCSAEGFEVQARIKVSVKNKSILATLHKIESEILDLNEISLSNYAWELLGAKENDEVKLSHAKPLLSLSYVRSKIYGNKLYPHEIESIVNDIANGRYSDIHIAMFLTSCAGRKISNDEVVGFTRSMVDVGERLVWPDDIIVDKHCVGGLPGNRTTPIVVSIVSAFGLTMPKTSSRAITSPSGTADTMEVLAPVNLNLKKMRQVVKKEGGCIVWGGAVSLSPADDILIRVEKAMDLDSEGQLVASVLSKKIAAGSNRVIIDIPIGPTAKVRTFEKAKILKNIFESASRTLGIKTMVIFSDGTQPIGKGIGPSLEAMDILSVLQCKKEAPLDLRKKSIEVAGRIIDFSDKVKEGEGIVIAEKLLDDGSAWKKFQAICEAQGGMREPIKSNYTHAILAPLTGKVVNIDNRRLANLAKLAGAPHDKAAGVELHVKLDNSVDKGEPIITVHSKSFGAMKYALSLLKEDYHIIEIEECE